MVDSSPLPAAEFQYRNNPDGSWDSICLRCFLTIGTAAKIEDLADMEAAHDCYTKKPPRAERLEP
jgi:ribosomal protein L40E